MSPTSNPGSLMNLFRKSIRLGLPNTSPRNSTSFFFFLNGTGSLIKKKWRTLSRLSITELLNLESLTSSGRVFTTVGELHSQLTSPGSSNHLKVLGKNLVYSYVSKKYVEFPLRLEYVCSESCLLPSIGSSLQPFNWL